jgi:[ribosomal protein S5]-alanine N-acetyltransferase
MQISQLRLVAIDLTGAPEEELQVPELGRQVALANVDNYRRNGFEKPWCAYFAVIDPTVVGCCAFKTPARDGRVEIAYFTFPELEGRGIATRMAGELARIAKAADPSVLVTAQTLPQPSASTSVLGKAGFVRARTVIHPEDGEVWEWELR